MKSERRVQGEAGAGRFQTPSYQPSLWPTMLLIAKNCRSRQGRSAAARRRKVKTSYFCLLLFERRSFTAVLAQTLNSSSSSSLMCKKTNISAFLSFLFGLLCATHCKKKKKLASNAACPNSLCSVRLDCPRSVQETLGRRSGRRNSASSGTSAFPPPAGLLHKQQPFTQQTPLKKSCLFAVKIIEWRSVCLRSLRRLRCQDSLFLYFFISPPVCCLAPHLIREGYKKSLLKETSLSSFLFIFTTTLSLCV